MHFALKFVKFKRRIFKNQTIRIYYAWGDVMRKWELGYFCGMLMRNFGKVKMLIVLVLALGLVNAELYTALNDLCASVRSLVPVISILMLIMAAAVYAAGQILGAETRSKVNVWATAMLVGGILGLVIAVLAPLAVQWIFNAFDNESPEDLCTSSG